jgi:hypothetical protein
MQLRGVVALVALSVVVGRAQSPDLATTPQGKVVIAFYKAMHLGDEASLRKYVTAESAKDFDGPTGKDTIEAMKMMTPDVPPTITKVDVTGKTAKVTFTPKGYPAKTWILVLVGADWKIDMKATDKGT